jgi:phosphoserine phosphatase
MWSKTLLAFDCDSTLTSIEGLDELILRKCTDTFQQEKLLAITASAMNGDMNFNVALLKRLEVVCPTEDDMKWMSQLYLEKITDNTLLF